MSINIDVLNNQQRQAVLTTKGPLLLLAGAGTGKTRALTYRIAHLIEDLGVSPYQILAITFTNKAAAEMRLRLTDLLDVQSNGMWVMTFHAMCVRILRHDAVTLGYTRNFSIYDDDDSKRLFKEIYAELNIDVRSFPLNAVRNKISQAKNDLISADQLEQLADNPYSRLVARIYHESDKRLKRADAMDFDDLLFNTWRLLDKNPVILDAYQERFRYILIDEYQDTNKAQYQISYLLAGKYRNIMVVGDDDQSIYSWRGADIRNILEFEQDYPEAKVLKLEQNYRSTANILNAANAVITHNIQRKDKQLYTQGQKGAQIALYQAVNEHDEGRWIAAEIEKLQRQGHGYGDFAVFYRTNAQSRVLEDMLIRAGVPYRIVGGTRFFDRAEIRDVMAYLKLVTNNADDIAAKRVINQPKRGLGKTTVAKIDAIAISEDCSFMDACEQALAEDGFSTAIKAKLGEFVQLIKDLKQIDGALRMVVEMIVERSGLLAALEAERTDESRSRIENIQEFYGVAAEFDFTHQDIEDAPNQELSSPPVPAFIAGPTVNTMGPATSAGTEELSGDSEVDRQPQLVRFMEWLALRTTLDTMADSEQSITLMTVHSAKGLEFKTVFIAGLEESLFPHIMSLEDGRGVEEERRLAYVAITRAREQLFLSHAQGRSLFGSHSQNPVSRFIAEIPAEYIQRAEIGSSGYSGTGREKRGDRQGIYGSGNLGSKVFGSGVVGGFDNNVQGATATAFKSYATEQRQKFVVGDAVDHKTFGRGKVLSINGDQLEVKFDNSGKIKKLLLEYAPIVKIKE